MPWKENYNKLVDFFNTYGHSKVPYRWAEDASLARWVQKTRSAEATLTKKQKEQLARINFQFSGDLRKEKRKKWLLMFQDLKKFFLEHGHSNVPSKYDIDKKLGRWVEVLRTRKGKLEEWQEKKLKEVNFQWPGDIYNARQKKWYKMYEKLVEFFKKYGHSDVPEYWPEDEALSIWVVAQRRPKKPLPHSKMWLLKEVNFSWNKEIGLNVRDDDGKFKKRIGKDSEEGHKG